MIHAGEILLNPPYQRGICLFAWPFYYADVQAEVVWSDEKQAQLIESIFRNYTIPQIVFAVQRDEDGDESRICVDGKQVYMYYGLE